MAQATRLAQKGLYTTSPNPRVGCVLVKNNQVIGEGYHQKAGQGHAEVNAIADVKKRYPESFTEQLKGCTAYVTLEPCSHFGLTPPCAQGLINANVGRVVSAMVDPNPSVSGRGLAMLEAAGITSQFGLLEQEAKALNVGFIKRMTTNFPYVRCKLAASLDGKTAMANGESQWITGSHARQDVQRLRAKSCAVISGADSVIFDNAKMNIRWQELGELRHQYAQNLVRQPVRVIIDSQQRLTPDLEIFQQHSPIIIVGIEKNKSVIQDLEKPPQWPHFVEHVTVNESIQAKHQLNSSDKAKVDLADLLKTLAKRGFNEVLVESGAKLSGAFIEQDLVDELILYQAPKLMGTEAKGLVNMPSIESLSAAKNLDIVDINMVGNDIRITAKLINSFENVS
ncbi:bifunctional diaminohydroxyphosphoribosylaminopyrimidine deaminase/5-amino-6-(5-phosphoribosylamino)uracil reductase RibD [Colwellia sp. RSH04]|uniref:bifunctional diaminohydroxyphosphoribosylaminopyrimidine deaminase/5-amino-6-(5-phosphoribosylamino)uracil reductase RibD n=1 Tax=Colwellia sp. RSH04 TaxID=2305464 RepID=UPI000E592078|nr:bifunctional diaminohydroxyphosphoribosylaminopyrimidine deaminase/5-amino-6-(5-phosphoribosylamino)uracil reductase RibD [Colwellia sp. RSH04]RHW78022.1 bifunctional diaminohydroxyphosphoribosylaminopyrimidine deaminase/5-amino-6-(5-phosphoribosylamino)uracil reductase RibD [Colwellia sp. RSH04]